MCRCPTADFTVPTEVCIGEQLIITNNSANGINYSWNFCPGSLAATPIADDVLNLSGTSTPTAVAIVEDLGNWFVF